MSDDGDSSGGDGPRTETEPTMDSQPIFNSADAPSESRENPDVKRLLTDTDE